jgi:hypothetical protein
MSCVGDQMLVPASAACLRNSQVSPAIVVITLHMHNVTGTTQQPGPPSPPGRHTSESVFRVKATVHGAETGWRAKMLFSTSFRESGIPATDFSMHRQIKMIIEWPLEEHTVARSQPPRTTDAPTRQPTRLLWKQRAELVLSLVKREYSRRTC